ncbi:MAG TPA: NAD-dependent deacylase [Bryobacteraceae bacterium]|nr:NAD-dependent deacylase [Bryobacteraceae bacterium]
MQPVREWLKEARSIAVLTGAGVSAESGVPTFRGDGGLWKQFRAEDLATPEAFARDPKLVWEWYDWRRGMIAQAKPNPGHYALAALEARTPKFALITQNVDGLHKLAGSRNVLRLHGSIWMIRCTGCGRESEDRRTPLPEIPPRCECGSLLRPGVVWFGEALPRQIWQDAEAAVRSAELFLMIGTSAVVYPAAGLAQMAKSCGARVVEVNIAESGFSAGVDQYLQGPSGELLPQLIA